MAKPTQADAEAAVRVLIEWAGDDPGREGLIDTPGRVARSYRELRRSIFGISKVTHDQGRCVHPPRYPARGALVVLAANFVARPLERQLSHRRIRCGTTQAWFYATAA